MITGTQQLTLFGGLAKVQIHRPIGTGLKRIFKNSTHYQCHTQNSTIHRDDIKYDIGDDMRFYEMFPDVLFRRLIFNSIYTWGELTKESVGRSLGFKPDIVTQRIIGFLDAGKRCNCYYKSGSKGDAVFSVNSKASEQMLKRYINLIPTEQAVSIAKARARKLAKRGKHE